MVCFLQWGLDGRVLRAIPTERSPAVSYDRADRLEGGTVRTRRYIVSHGDLQQFHDPELPLESLSAADAHRERAADITPARVLTRAG
jgi:hypothetical protein